MTFSDFVKGLDADLERLGDAVVHLAHVDDVFCQVMAIIGGNPELNQSDVFQEWLGMAYADSMVIGVRRLVDTNKQTVSLTRILERVKPRAADFKRAWFVGRLDPTIRDKADRLFTKLVGGAFSELRRATVQAKQDELKAAVSSILDYANQYVAHTTAQPTVKRITYTDVRLAVVSVFRTLQWLRCIIQSAVMTSPVPKISTNWLKYFRVPWLAPNQPVPSYKHLNDLLK